MNELSKHFSFDELTHSAGHPQFEDVNKKDAAAYLDNLRLLCAWILEPLREKFGAITINSGFRCESLNRALPGSPTSQHRFGQAADVNAADTSDAKHVEMARWMKAEFETGRMKFGQCLIERGCLHVSLPGGHLGQVGRAALVAGKWTVQPLEEKA